MSRYRSRAVSYRLSGRPGLPAVDKTVVVETEGGGRADQGVCRIRSVLAELRL